MEDNEMTESERYHSQVGAKVPRLTYSIAKTLITKSPLHAWYEHPKLGGHSRPTTKAMDIGSIAHDMLLGGGDPVEVIDADSYRTKAAKDARDAAREAGSIPVLRKDYEAAESLSEAALAQFPDVFHSDHLAEHTVTWEAFNGVECQSRFDWVSRDTGLILDIKTSSDACPRTFGKKIMNMGYDIQFGFYSMAFMSAWPGVAPEWIFLVIESEPPYAVSVIKPDQEFIDHGMAKATRALKLWKECLESNQWPGYGYSVVSAPVWAISQEDSIDG
jgi:hypothetical protein